MVSVGERTVEGLELDMRLEDNGFEEPCFGMTSSSCELFSVDLLFLELFGGGLSFPDLSSSFDYFLDLDRF